LFTLNLPIGCFHQMQDDVAFDACRLHHGGTMVIKQLQWLTAPLLFDNNTWNNTHIANVGSAMSSPEKAAWEIFNSLDVKYVLVVFGGLFPAVHIQIGLDYKEIYCSDGLLNLSGFVGYPSDDINKFLWMVRIGGGVFPHIKEPDYLVSS